MSFAPFAGHVTANAPPTIHRFAAKLGYDSAAAAAAPSVVHETRYHNAGNNVQFAMGPATGQITLEGVKFRQAESVVVVSAAQPGTVTLAGMAPVHAHTHAHAHTPQYHRKLPSFARTFENDVKSVEIESGFAVNTGVKYQTISSSTVNLGNIAYGGQTSYVQAETVHQMKAEQRVDKREFREELTHDVLATMMQQHQVTQAPLQQGQQLLLVLTEPKDAAAIARSIKQEGRQDRSQTTHEFISIGDVTDTTTWQAIGPGGVAEYLSALPLPLHQLLKYAPPDCKREEQQTMVTAVNANVIPVTTITQVPANSVVLQTATVVNHPVNNNGNTILLTNKPVLKKRKKKCGKEKKERLKPGEIRLTTALDGSTLYCCPECHMAYPERGLLEQHLLGHTMERRFICDICNAALKRKDHLTRHKQSHNPDRPHVCNVCTKAFKRKEQLTLHFVIHSGEKRHVCNECGKGFYRKDHLRKHTRSHIARRVKAELSQQGAAAAEGEAPEPAPPAPADPAL